MIYFGNYLVSSVTYGIFLAQDKSKSQEVETSRGIIDQGISAAIHTGSVLLEDPNHEWQKVCCAWL